MQEHIRAAAPEVLDQIAGGQQLSDESKDALRKANEDFAATFQTTSGVSVSREPVDPLASEDVNKTALTVSRKKAAK